MPLIEESAVFGGLSGPVALAHVGE